jgi:hypothetical protein
MQEITAVIQKYKNVNVDHEIADIEGAKSFALKFYKDALEIYDSITRLKNIDRNPTGFNFNDAAILGLLVRIWKILKKIAVYHEEKNAEFICMVDRQAIESAIMAKFLMISGDDVIEDYRKCSYKDRLRILKDAEADAKFFQVAAGQRLLKSVKDKMTAEGYTVDSFEQQKKNNWKPQGKNFFQIFSEVAPKEMYKFIYGIPSESVHGSWYESLEFNLVQNEDGTYTANPFFHPADIRYIAPLLKVCHEPFELWVKRIQVNDEYIEKVLKWLDSVNTKLFLRMEF